jgi:hypothetical protein
MTARKPASRRQNRITRDIGPVRQAPKAPSMPRGLCKPAQDAWRAYWADPVSGATTGSDLPLLIRWAKNLDRYFRLVATADATPVVSGSTGQPTGNPLYTLALKIEASIVDSEKQLGIGPLNRLKLGLALSETSKTLAELNAEAADGEADDPRLALAPPAD